jgi:hypothetical protein
LLLHWHLSQAMLAPMGSPADMQVITYRITTVRVNDEPARDQAAEAQAASKDSASGAARLRTARCPLHLISARKHVHPVATAPGSACEWGAPPLSAGNGGDRPDVPHAPAGAEARPIASVQQSAAEQSAAAMAAASAEAAGAAAPGSDGARAAAAAAEAPQDAARAAEQGGSDTAAAPAEDAPEKQEVSATRAGRCGSAGRRCRAVGAGGAQGSCTAVRRLQKCNCLLAGRCRTRQQRQADASGPACRMCWRRGCCWSTATAARCSVPSSAASCSLVPPAAALTWSVGFTCTPACTTQCFHSMCCCSAAKRRALTAAALPHPST